MNDSSKFTQLGNIIFKGSAVRELAEAIQSETAQTEKQTKLFKVVLVGGITKTFQLNEKDFEEKTNSKKLTPLVLDMNKMNWRKLRNQVAQESKKLLISAISYKNELQNGNVIFQSQSFEEMEKRNLIPKNLKFNHQKVEVLPDNTLLVRPSELYNIGL